MEVVLSRTLLLKVVLNPQVVLGVLISKSRPGLTLSRVKHNYTKMADRQEARSRRLKINHASKDVLGEVNDSELLDMYRLHLQECYL